MPFHLAVPAGDRCLSRLVWLGLLFFLWQALIRHLSVEWRLNPQYAFGWAVPLLCAHLVWRDWHGAREAGLPRLDSVRRPALKSMYLGAALAVCYAPIRLIQEANPDWRLVSWALAFEVIGLTWLVVPVIFQFSRCPGDSPLRFSPSVFPLFFFLVAVPWPTMVERPAVRSLTAAAAAGAEQFLALLGIPVLLHGTVIETCNGSVSVDEACSGIRSLQAALMLALFFGQVYHLSFARRFFCLLSGLGFSVLFNLVRTTLLALITARSGSAALAVWHDPAGLTILLGCFICTWLLTAYLGLPGRGPSNSASLAAWSNWPAGNLHWALIGWILFAEFGTEGWYRLHERNLGSVVRWRAVFRPDLADFRQLGFTETSRRFLRFDEGLNASWQQGSSRRWQAIFLRWAPRRVSVCLARNHTPQDCLVASGHELISESQLLSISVREFWLPFRHYLTRDETGPVHVFYCLWEDRPAPQSFNAEWLSYRNRLRPVIDGQRNCGQRSLELALWGAANNPEAEQALRELLPKIIQIEN